MTKDEQRQMLKVHKRTCDKIARLLVGLGPEVQGCILADLTATWLVGFPKPAREPLLKFQLDQIRKFIPGAELEHYGEAGHPQDRH
jgi:hypothetical protein